MKYLFYSIIIILVIYSCGTSNKTINSSSQTNEDIVVIENDSLEYQIIITDIGFSTFLLTIAKPMEFYSQNFYENKNVFYVSAWNRRVSSPLKYGDFYGNIIDYSSHINYGIEVNYKLYNYFKFVEHKYRIRF